MDTWDAGEGRIRAAGRAIRAYNRHEKSGRNVSVAFTHPHAVEAMKVFGFPEGGKYRAPVIITPKEFRLIEKKYGNQIRTEHEVHV
jgi:hypothetical protein